MNFDKIINRHINTAQFHFRGTIINKVYLHDGKDIINRLELNLGALHVNIDNVYNHVQENDFHYLELSSVSKRRKIERFKNDSGFRIDYKDPFFISSKDSLGSKVFNLYLHIEDVDFKEVDFYTKSFELDTWHYVIYSIKLNGVFCLGGIKHSNPVVYFSDLLSVENTARGSKIEALQKKLLDEYINITKSSLNNLDKLYNLLGADIA